MPKKPFVFNDEKEENSYGFSIPTKGISLKRFKKNPIMLDSHWNSTRSVLGKWENITVKGGLLLGEPVFDSEDENVTVIEGKVERGFITSCSMGIRFKRDDLKIINGKLFLTKCELYEVSIVAVPSNANSIRLYVDDSDKPLTDDEVQQLCLSVLPVDAEEITPTTKNTENQNMKITLTSVAAIALGFQATQLEHEASAVSEAIVKLEAEKKAAELKLSGLQQAQEAAKLQAITDKVDLAIKANPSLAAKKEDFVNLGIANESLLDTTLAAMPKTKSLAAQVTGGEGGAEMKTVEDFMKLSLDAQLAFKAENPEAYKKLFNVNQ